MERIKGSAQALGALIESADMQFVDRPARPMGLTVSKASIRRPRPMGIVVHQHQDRLLYNSICDFYSAILYEIMNGTLPLQKVATYRSSGRARPPCVPLTAKSGHGHESSGPRHVKHMHSIHSTLLVSIVTSATCYAALVSTVPRPRQTPLAGATPRSGTETQPQAWYNLGAGSARYYYRCRIWSLSARRSLH